MINIDDKFKCCGCNACVQRCPKQCIGMYEDEEGFLYPQVDTALCIDCGICEKVCPVINQSVEKEPIAAFAMQHADKELRLKSSSGGIFSLIATDVIKQGGVVFGARWNEKLELIHDYTETQEGLAPFRGSKYVQSYIGDTYKLAEEFLRGKDSIVYWSAMSDSGIKKIFAQRLSYSFNDRCTLSWST
ncbi:4Fe-4S binding protein [Bacteroides sp. CR5/BHMF/2]|nr:4Fe-4S binding protein [Bacteroides sp. CR5/BHMF/2]